MTEKILRGSEFLVFPHCAMWKTQKFTRLKNISRNQFTNAKLGGFTKFLLISREKFYNFYTVIDSILSNTKKVLSRHVVNAPFVFGLTRSDQAK